MNAAFAFLIPLFVVATLGVLAVGIGSMFRGGAFNRKHGNRLMQLRVLLQAIAVGLIVLAMMFGARG